MNRRIAKFEKVTYKQFLKDMNDTFQLTDNSEKYVKDMYDNIKLPKRATTGSAGYDFFSPLDYFKLKPGESIKIPTGIKCVINNHWVLQIFPRSGLVANSIIQLALLIVIIFIPIMKDIFSLRLQMIQKLIMMIILMILEKCLDKK